MKYTVVRHSAWASSKDPQFERGLESAAVSGRTAKATEKLEAEVLAAGGVLFDTYDEAEDFADKQSYPPGYPGLIPVARGKFSQAMSIDGREIYIPTSAFVRLYEAVAACEAPEGTQVDDVLKAFQAEYHEQKERA